MNGVWRSLWPDVVEAPSRSVRVQEQTRQALEDIAVLMGGSELGSITVEELEEFVASDGEPLSNQDLIELQNKPLENEEEHVEDPVLSSSGVQEALSKIYSGLNMLESMDRNVDRVSSVKSNHKKQCCLL